MYSTLNIIVGALAGLLLTVVVTILWPHGKAGALKVFVGPLLGVLVAYFVIVYVKL
jgi:fructose-specific phosphotransferase system IIC component